MCWLHLLLARRCADALVGSRLWFLMLLLLLLWLARRVVASLPICRPWSFSSLLTLVCLLCFLSTLCALCRGCVVGRQLEIIAIAEEQKKNFRSTPQSRRLHMPKKFGVRAYPRVKASLTPGGCVSLHVDVYSTSNYPISQSCSDTIMSDNLLSLAGWYILPNVSPLSCFSSSAVLKSTKHQYDTYSLRPSYP